MAMQRMLILLILFGFFPALADLNDSDCAKNIHVTAAETSWESRTICNAENFETCTKPSNENADRPIEYTHGKKTENVAVLFHGLSDSPYFLKDIGYELFKMGMNVMIPRLTGHGTCAEHLNNKYVILSDWIGGGKHRGDLPWAFETAKELGDKIYVGGFSLGGALATYSVLNKLDTFSGLLLFSPALKLHKSIIWKIKLGAFFSTPLHRIYGGNKTYGQGVRYQKISVEASYETLLLARKLQEFKKHNKAVPEIPVFVAVTEYDTAIDVNYVLDFVTNYLKGPKKILVYGNPNHTSKYPNADFIATDGIRHASIVLSNAQWSEPEENPYYSTFSNIFTEFWKSQISQKH